MTLFSSIHVGKTGLFASQIGLHVTGNNIANVNTPGYIRQEVRLVPAPTMKLGRLLLGLGVQVDGIVQRADEFLDNQLRGAASDLAGAETQEQAYLQLEQLLGELSDNDLSTSLVNFFGSIHDILNQPEDIAIRNLAVLRGVDLTHQIKQIADRGQDIRVDLNDRVEGAADQINQLLTDIARLNVQISTTEGGTATRTSNDASLNHERRQLLSQLSEIIDIRTAEQPSGGIAVYAGGDQLVFDAIAQQVKVEYSPDRGMNVARIELAHTNTPLASTSGELVGLISARDDIVGGFLDQLDDLARTFISEFNQIYSGGQGLIGLDDVRSEFTVDAIDAPLDSTGLTYVPETGSFQVLVRDKTSGLTQTTDVFVQLNGFDDDTTLNDLATALDAIDGVSSQTTSSRGLTIQADSSDVEFAFRQDTSGVLAALGINTFFTGQSALDMGVHEMVREDPARFAASRNGIGVDTENGVLLAGFLDAPLESKNGQSLADLQERLTTETSQATALARSVTDGFRVYHDSLEGRQMALGGVSIDEEVIRLITFQRSFQASARFISVVSEVLDDLVNL